MRVLFSNPPWWHEVPDSVDGIGRPCRMISSGVRAGSRWPHVVQAPRFPDHFTFGGYLPYPFFMGYAATYVAQKTGAQVVFRDSVALSESYRSYFHFLDENKFDFIFIESASPSWDHDSRLIRQIHAHQPRAKIVVTGPITTNNRDIIDTLPVYACIRGEYEKGAVKVIEGASGLLDFDLLTTEEMNQAPFPYYDDTYALRYWDDNPRGQTAPHAHVWSSRGCPFKCIFCVWPATMTGNDPDGTGKRVVRYYSADYMEGFLRELVGRYKYRTIYFDDDTFNLGDAHVERMCAVMQKIGLPWSAMCRADTIKDDTWRLMRNSGCFGVKLGFESGNQYVVDKIVNKRLDLQRGRDVVRLLKSMDMAVHGTFTIGLPGETEEQMNDTRRFIVSLPFDSYQLSGCAEIEGTPLASLSERGSLERYEGAKIDTSYMRHSDGSRKIEKMSIHNSVKSAFTAHRLIYCDSSLTSEASHQFSTCSAIVEAAYQKGTSILSFVNKALPQEIAKTVQAVPLFRDEYPKFDDPLSGPMEALFHHANATLEDLDIIEKVRPIVATDVIYWNAAAAPELLGIIQWVEKNFTPTTCPRVVVQFASRSGRDPLSAGFDPMAYRFAARRISPAFQPFFVFASFSADMAKEYTEILAREVIVLPYPTGPVQSWQPLVTPVISFLGNQTQDKGFQFLPDLVKGLLARHPNLHVIAHNGLLTSMEVTVTALAAMASEEDRLDLVFGPAGGELWTTLLAGTSLLVLPYQPSAWKAFSSYLLAEAIQHGIPVVVPENTSLSRLVREYNDCGVVFNDWSAKSMEEAIERALADLPALTDRAGIASKLWQNEQGAERFLAAVFGTVIVS